MKTRNRLPGKSISLEKNITDFSLFIKQLCPEASIKISEESFEDEDAMITVSPPAYWSTEQCNDLEERLAEKSVDILLETGYSLLVGVLEPSRP
jgi:hypothetical protein